MAAIHIRTTLESDTPHLPQLRPLIGKPVEITVEETTGTPLPLGVRRGTGNWAAVVDAARFIQEQGGYDFEAVRKQDECDSLHAHDHLP